jgi:sec-independent protein translocase protein TatA
MGVQEWLIVAAIFLLLFGAKKLPEMARSIGQSARVFKGEMKGMQADDEARARNAQQPPQQALPASTQNAGQPEPAPQSQPAEGASTPDTPR